MVLQPGGFAQVCNKPRSNVKHISLEVRFLPAFVNRVRVRFLRAQLAGSSHPLAQETL